MRGWDNGVTDPKSLTERSKVASRCSAELKVKFPILIDRMDDRAAVQYAGWPERLFVVDKQGKVVYAGGQGPWGYWPTDRYKGRGGRRGEKGKSLAAFLQEFLKPAATGEQKK